jgi:NADPH-dependent 2,4-dienoyl-CoA reductase/sulfur reductase-like enzyme
MQRFDLAIVGGGLASARAIKSYREAGADGTIALLTRDTSLPYHRPPLSKAFLRGETDDKPLVEDEAFYRANGVEVLLETSVERVDTREHALVVGGDRVGYGKLLLATGAWPRRLAVPGADLDGIFTLRTFDNSSTIREAARSAGRAVIVGAGFIGMEVAASLRQLGLEVTMIHLGRWLFDQLGVEELSGGLASLYERRGVELVLGHKVEAFQGAGRLERVTTDSGKVVDADLAVVGIGVEPVTDFLEGSGIELDNGIVVNDRFETSAPDVYAAGDAARFFDPLFGRHRRIEHWSNANYQGTEVGKVLAGAEGRYDTVSSFFSEVFGITIKVFGDGRRDAQVVTYGSLSDESMYALYADENEETIGALSIGQSEDVEELLKQRIAAHAPLQDA